MSPQQTIAHYRITAKLGSGGMGEVWRATDTTLGREVAIKILPDAFAQDADRMARFSREAHVLASLNHPNIAAIHEVQERAIVMELVDGPTPMGPLREQEALPLILELIDALEYAHDKGVIHRDLKPSNLKLSSEGRLKVLDFGLAKALWTEAVQGDPSSSPTLTMQSTRSGVLLGTAAYMSPEQARGQAVDKRTDIWSFGVVVYELLTGKRMFRGDTVSDTVAAVLTQDPDLSLAPPRFQKLLRLCLKRDPHHRLHDISGARLLLEPAAVTGASKLPWAIAAVAAGLAIAFGAVAWFLAKRPAPPEMRLEIVTRPSTDPTSFAVSPDGRKIAYTGLSDGEERVWVRSLDGTAEQLLPGTEGALLPFWSPDSRSIGFWADAQIKRTDLAGGAPHTLASAPVGAGADWSSGGVILFARDNTNGLFRVPASGGPAVQVTKLGPGVIGHRLPRFLPDGKTFLFYLEGRERGIYVGRLDGSAPKRLLEADSAAQDLAPDWLLWVRQNALVASRFRGEGRITGDAVTLAPMVGVSGPVGGAGAFSVSRSGLIAWRTGSGGKRQLIWYSRSGERIGSMGLADSVVLLHPELAPDGRRVAVSRGAMGEGDIWISDSTRGSRFTFDAADDRYSVWSPDGSHLAFASSRQGGLNLYIKAANGSGVEEPMLISPDAKRPNSWSPNGRLLLYNSSLNNGDLMILPVAGNRKPYAFLSTPYNECEGAFSPDGKWVAYQSNESGRDEIYLRPFPGPGGVWQISAGGGTSPRWRKDGKELYFLGPGSKLMAASITTQGTSITAGEPVMLFAVTSMVNSINRPQYDVSGDGRFLINTSIADSTTAPITLLLNWRPPR